MFDAERAAAIHAKLKEIPCVDALGLKILALDRGACKLSAPHQRQFDGLFPTWHGGMIATIADCAAWLAIVTELGPDEPMVTTDLSIRYLAPCTTDLVATGKLIKAGRTLRPTQVELFDAANLRVALASVCYMRIEKVPGA